MFNSETGSKAKRQQDYQRLKKENDELREENLRLHSELSILQRRIEELETVISNLTNKNPEEKSDEKSDEIIINPILLKYLEITSNNMTRLPQGRRYDGLHEFFSLLSLMGPHYFGILTSNLMFPTYKTAKTYTKNLLECFGINEFLFNGDIRNIVHIMELFLPDNFIGKAVIMVDAAYVTPYVKINKDGRVEGLLDLQQIDPDLADVFINDDNEFLEFIRCNLDSVIEAEFGVTFAPLDPRFNPFPIACVPSVSGKATPKIIEIIESIILQMPNNIKVIGLGTDGDNAYNIYSNAFIDQIFEDFENFLSLNAVQIVEKYAPLIHFSDPYHLTKRDRYRKVSRDAFIVSPNVSHETRSYKDLIDLGIPHYLLDDNKGRKMEDDLPLKLFNLQTIQRIMKDGDFHLLISMLPSTLILESLHRESLSKQSTVDYLLFGSSIILLFYLMTQAVINEKQEIFAMNPVSYRKARCFTDSWCKQYILTTIGIASQIMTENMINTGACSSHYQEHVFANVRTHSKGDNSHMKFIKSMQNIILEHALINAMNIEIDIPKSRSDSGKKIFDDTKIENRPMQFYLQEAKRLWRNIVDFRRFKNLPKIDGNRTKMSFDEIATFLGDFNEKNRYSISTKSTGMVKTAGLNNMIFWNADEQLNDLGDDDE